MGTSIIEMVIVLVAAAVMTVLGIQQDVANHRAQVFAAEGQNEQTIVNAIGDWATDNYAAILSAYTASGSSTITPPTISQLYTAGNLKQPHNAGPFWGGAYVIQMSMVPAGCTEAAGNCAISYAMYPSQPITKGGKYDTDGASQIAQAGGGQFGFSRSQGASTISGLNGAWSATNPLGNVPAVVLATNGPATDGNSLYIRRDGSLTWTGDQNVNGVNLNNVGTITGKTVNLQAGNSLNIGSGATYYGDANNAAIRTNGGVYFQNTAGSASANIDEVGNVNSNGTVTAPTVNFNTTSGNCSSNTVTMRGANQMWVCNQWGNWIPISQLIGNVYTISKFLGYADGGTISKPTCSGGTATATVIPQATGVNVAADPPWETSVYKLLDEGSYWYLQISMEDANGNWYSGNNLGLSAEVDTQCTFGNT
jgi:hypothetical protein